MAGIHECGAGQTSTRCSAPATQFETFALKTRTTETLRIRMVKSNERLCLQILEDFSVISQKGRWSLICRENTYSDAATSFPKDARIEIKDAAIKSPPSTTRVCGQEWQRQRLHIRVWQVLAQSFVSLRLVPVAGADKQAAAFTLESSRVLPAMANFSPLGSRGAEENPVNKAPRNRCRRVPSGAGLLTLLLLLLLLCRCVSPCEGHC